MPNIPTPDPFANHLFALATPPPEFSPYLLTEEDGTRRIRLYISIVDAVMEAMIQHSTLGALTAFAVSDLRLEKDITPGLHLAWGAHSGRLLLTEDGKLRSYLQNLERSRIECISNIPNDSEQRTFGMIRELCGLYAWQDTAREFPYWGREQRNESIRRGMQAALNAGLASETAELNQLAVFDPERIQWHFINIADLASAMNSGMAA